MKMLREDFNCTNVGYFWNSSRIWFLHKFVASFEILLNYGRKFAQISRIKFPVRVSLRTCFTFMQVSLKVKAPERHLQLNLTEGEEADVAQIFNEH